MLQDARTLKILCHMKESRHRRTQMIWWHCYVINSTSIETESRLVVARGQREEGIGVTANGRWGFFLRWWNIPKLDSGHGYTTLWRGEFYSMWLYLKSSNIWVNFIQLLIFKIIWQFFVLVSSTFIFSRNL